ncbi:talin-2-like isoform X2 [Leguminivora glycinivorella]|uniref:talin-2-like isoform X2 n=1 Tax=Leguminivora glycinivorella TaxID=1035111 RepID=UPI0020105F75|nr:talin-2-like isoform X2 [Leguminivora glycinivorella]
MPSLSLKIILEDGAVTRTMKFPNGCTVADAVQIVEEKVLTGGAGKDYGLFLTSADDELSGCWLEDPRRLDYYLLKDGDSLHYRCRVRTLKIRMLDGSVKTMQVDESKSVETLMMNVCSKLGITNHEEYGLCREDEPMEDHPGTGTLTLKRKHQHKEKDAALQQLSKKLKTDDNVEWLEQHKTLREMAVAPTETLLLKRRLFYSDRKVDARDPVQLNLLYVQARDAVLEGRHPVTEEQAVQFAGIQCQVQYGDFQEDKHKPGFIENLSEFLPHTYANSWGMEKKVIKEHKKHSGLTQLEAKHLYTKTARDLPTYGVTFFLVKEMQKGKKKLVPRLLGINASSILRLDETTKEVLQVWPLTQVKTYKAGKGEMFTLNFGDYSEKEYCVKTNDAYRIRDILQGYIDLIRKRMEAAFNNSGTEGGIIHQATVESGKGSTMEVVSHSAQKTVETSFVGPSKIITAEPGSKAQAVGAQIFTAHSLIVKNKQTNEQTAKLTGVTMRGEMSIDTGRKLNDLNANAVKIVTLLNDPNQGNIEAAKRIVEDILRDYPTVVAGVKHCIDHQTDEAAKKKLTFELNELSDNVNQLNGFMNPQDAQEAAMRIADLTTQMYFALDSNVKKRSMLVRNSRQSFIEDEKTQATLQRASFINCVGAANHAIDDARDALTQKYDGPALSPKEVEDLERSARDRLARLNAAIARLTAAHSDPKNIDYAAAVSAMNTIKELVPKLAKDAQLLASVNDGKDRSGLLKEMQELLDATAMIAQNVGCDDLQKMHDVADNFAKKSRRLQFIFGHGNARDKENVIKDLSKEIDDKTRLLVASLNDLAGEVNDPMAAKVINAAHKCVNAVAALTSCAELTASSIYEPYCRSALLATLEDLSSSEKLLDSSYKSLLDQPEGRKRADAIRNQNADLRKALDKLRSQLDENNLENKRRDLHVAVSQAQDTLKQPLTSKALTPAEEKQLKESLAKKLAELNAAIAGLINSTYARDPSNIDHGEAELSMEVIQRLLPEVVEDVRALNSGKSPAETRALMDDLKALCVATNALADGHNCKNPGVLKTIADQYAKSASRLAFVCTPPTSAQKNQEHVVDKAKDVLDRSTMMVEAVDKLVKSHPDDFRNRVVDEKAQQVERAASALLGTAQVTASTLNTSHCRAALHQAAADLSRAISQLDTATHELVGADLLGQQRKNFDEAVRELMAAISGLEEDSKQLNRTMSAEKEKNRLKFVASRLAAKSALDGAVEELNKTGKVAPLAPPQAALLQARLADKLATLNAAIATLLTATRDPENPDYVLAESATATIQELVPDIVKDAKTLPAGKDQSARANMLELLRELCEATKTISGGDNGGKEEELQDAVEKYTKASGKLVYTFNPRANAAKEDQIIDLTKSTCQKTSELLEKVYDLAQNIEGQVAADLDDQGSRLADAAQNLLTTAEITAPSISSPLCQSSLLTSVSALSSSVDHLFSSPVLTLPEHAARRQQLQMARAKVDQEIEKLKEALKDERVLDAAAIEKAKKEKLRFIASMASAEVAIQNAEKEITEPYGKPLPASEAAALQDSLSNRLASLNAAINSLVVATSDLNNPDYQEAETASKTIRELIPDIVKDSKNLSSTMDQQARKDLLEQIKALCEASRLLGASSKSDQLSPEELNKAATQYSLASGKLNFVFNPHVDQKKTHQIIDTCKAACIKTSEMLLNVHELAKQAGEDGPALDTKGSHVSDAARSLLTTAQLTAHSVNSPRCQTALLESSDRLTSSIEDLQTIWTPVVKAPKFKAIGEELAKEKQAVDGEIATLRKLVKEGAGIKGKKPPVPARTDSEKTGKKPEARVIGATKEFLDRLRLEGSMEKESCGEAVKSPVSATHPQTDEEKRAKLQFGKCIDDARKNIASTEQILQSAFVDDGKDRAPLDDAHIQALNKQMEHKVARANAATAHLLACRSGDNPDYKLGTKCVTAISDLMPTIAADAIRLADQKDPVGRKLFLGDTMGLCTASKNLCDTAKTDRKKLKDAAVEFGNHSSKLLYAISTDIDPSQEKEILLRVKSAGDVACRVAEHSGEAPTAGRCASQATLLMYTAKLVAPSIQDPECQDALTTASKDLTDHLKTIPSTTPKLTQEIMELEKILEALRSDVASGNLVKKKEEKLVIEDTPLRKLTAQIIEDCKQNAECTSNPAAERKAMADFANKLSDGLRIMDVANARCKKEPHDLRRREELEDAVLNLQHLVLQCRPRGGAVNEAQSNIVNLSDFLTDVSTNATRLQRAAHAAENSAGPHSRAAGAVRAQCQELCDAAAKATPKELDAPMVDVDHAAKECVSRVQKINTTIECCPEGAGKTNLQKEARPLNESCTLLQYASQSALATAQCAALDEALNDLTDLENRIDKMLQPRQGEKFTVQTVPSPSLLASRARLATAAAGVNRDAQELAPAFTRYVANMRAHVDVADEQKRRRLADHLKKLQDRLKLLTLETGRQVVTWRPANEGDVIAITDDILKELDSAEEVIGLKTDKNNNIAYEDLKKLLLPVETYRMEGDKKKLEAKLEPYATKLNSMAETLTLSIGKPGSLARTAHVTAESAVQLTALAKALKSDEDPTRNSKIDEVSQELCFVTYNLLKTAETANNEPSTFESRRRMLDACRSLSDAINKLVRASSSGDKLQRECNEMNRALQLRQSTIQARPTCALPYAECVSALQTQHEAIKNLKSEEPVSREEFSTSLDYLASAVNNNVDYAEHCAYLLSVSEQHPELSKDGMVDTERIQKLIAALQDSCFRTTRPGIVHQAKEESSLLSKQLSDLKQVIQDSSSKIKDQGVKQRLLEASSKVEATGTKLKGELNKADVSVETLTPTAFATIEALSALRSVTEHPALTPVAAPSPAAQKRADEVIQQSKELLTRASGLMRAIKTSESQQAMTWVMFNTYTKGVIEISEKLVTCAKENGQQAGLIEGAIEEDEGDMTAMSYVQTQVLIATKWLQKPSFKAQIKTDGEQATRNVIDIGKKVMEHQKEADREEMKHLIEECEQLLQQCSAHYTMETGSVLMDRLKDLAKAVDRSIVTMVVEDLLEDEEPLADMDIMIDAERDEAKRKFILERKIADLLAHLGRVTKTARVLADVQGGDGTELRQCTNQTELFAPMLVKAAEKRVMHPTETAVVEEYRTQLAQYSQSLSKVRDLCDRAVDPMQFVQTAEETMQRMKEESTAHQNDLQKCSSTSTAIRKLAHRVINVSMSSQNAQRDPELMRALAAAQQKLKEAEPAKTLRASKLPDWRDNITEILRATGEVESVLGGEMIFQKQRETDQPIYNAALNLHAAVREWSARDNEIVAVAKRMAVLMAKLSDHMHDDRKRDVISTSKAIVAASHEVARLARKLALECTDMRIRTNLLQVCDQIPTISGQLKMLTTVKGSFLGHQGSEEDIEAMNMLIGNAQNLMMSIQDVVKAAASASVKIRSQRGGPKIRWVRKNYH